jgi:uncharacterized spore protein YtfJ
VEKLVDGIVGTVISNGGSRTVFSEPVQHGDRSVIPVARVTYRFGFGGGSGTGPQVGGQGPVPGGDGGGGGGMLNARPVGFIETGSTGSRFVPIIDWSQILTVALGFTGAGLLIVLWGSRPGRHQG